MDKLAVGLAILHRDLARAAHFEALAKDELGLPVLAVLGEKTNQRSRGGAGCRVLAEAHTGREHAGGEAVARFARRLGEDVDRVVADGEDFGPAATFGLDLTERGRVAHRY